MHLIVEERRLKGITNENHGTKKQEPDLGQCHVPCGGPDRDSDNDYFCNR